MTKQQHWIGVKPGMGAKLFVPHRMRMRFLAQGNRILRKATEADCLHAPDKIMPLAQAQRESKQIEEAAAAAAGLSPPVVAAAEVPRLEIEPIEASADMHAPDTASS